MRVIQIPGGEPLRLANLLLDINGTITDRGTLLPGVADRLARLGHDLEVTLVTADTLSTAEALGVELRVPVMTIRSGEEKGALVTALGPATTVAIGNGRNDEAMLRAAALGIAIVGPEGAATSALLAGDIVCTSVTQALDLLLDGPALGATLRP
jgi:P-type E1-E2 ATPase